MTGFPDSTASNADSKRAGAGTYVVRIVIIIAATAVLVVIGNFLRERFLSTEELYQRAEEALNEELEPDYETAHGYAMRILDREPDSNRANLLVALTLASPDRFEEALEYAARIADDSSPEALQGRCLAGNPAPHRRTPGEERRQMATRPLSPVWSADTRR